MEDQRFLASILIQQRLLFSFRIINGEKMRRFVIATAMIGTLMGCGSGKPMTSVRQEVPRPGLVERLMKRCQTEKTTKIPNGMLAFITCGKRCVETNSVGERRCKITAVMAVGRTAIGLDGKIRSFVEMGEVLGTGSVKQVRAAWLKEGDVVKIVDSGMGDRVEIGLRVCKTDFENTEIAIDSSDGSAEIIVLEPMPERHRRGRFPDTI